jgi:hypothetical protein
MKQKSPLLRSGLLLLLLSYSTFSFSEENIQFQPHLELEIPTQQKNRALKNVLKELENKYKVSIAYKSEVLQDRVVKTDLGSTESLEEVLHELLKDHPLEFKKVRDDFYVIEMEHAVRKPNSSSNKKRVEDSTVEANIIVKGTVTSASDQQTIPGVNILIKGTSIGTVTDFNGEYTLEAPEDGTLVFSSIGYATQEISINGREAIDVALADDLQNLEEVVVVGYGTRLKEELSGSVSSITNEQLHRGNSNGSYPGSGIRRDHHQLQHTWRICKHQDQGVRYNQ